MRIPTGDGDLQPDLAPVKAEMPTPEPWQGTHAIQAVAPNIPDAHEDLQVAALFGWTIGPALEVVEKYKESLKKYPNPPAGNLTTF